MTDWSRWAKSDISKSFGRFLREDPVNTGNRSAQLGPAERAKQLGLQSNGKGGYVDPQTGQVVARTVNNELIFYDNNRATGGAISDSSGGAELTQAAPSWVEPESGMVLVPPSRAESPAELAAIPDPIPATPPMGYDKFIMGKREQMKQMAKMAPPEQPQPEQGMEEPAMGQEMPMGMSMEDFNASQLVKRMKPMYGNERINHLRGKLQRMQSEPPSAKKEVPADAMPNKPENIPDEKPVINGVRRSLLKAIETAQQKPERMRGAGANNLSREDLEAFKKYVKEGPQNETVDISDEDFEWAKMQMRNYKTLAKKMNIKGRPHENDMRDTRGDEVLRSYLSNLGQSAIDGSPLPLSASELDHGIPLASGGTDDHANWRWIPRRFNNFKKDYEDEVLLDKIQKQLDIDPDDQNLKHQAQELKNMVRGDMKAMFARRGWDGLNQADIMNASGPQGEQFLKALSDASGTKHYRPKREGEGGRAPTVGLKMPELKQKLIQQLGIPTSADIEGWDKDLFDTLQKLEDARSDLDTAKRANKKRKANKFEAFIMRINNRKDER